MAAKKPAGKQLERPRIIKGHGASKKVYVVTHGKEHEGLPLYPTRKYLANDDFETVAAELGFLAPTSSVLVKLGSIVRHVDEGLGENGHPLDVAAVRGLLEDPEILALLAELDDLALLPVAR